MDREQILQELQSRLYRAEKFAKDGKYYQTKKRNEGRIHAYKIAINLLKTNERRTNAKR